jgi:glycosyltransferase involved in cell wall biosynthesis
MRLNLKRDNFDSVGPVLEFFFSLGYLFSIRIRRLRFGKYKKKCHQNHSPNHKKTIYITCRRYEIEKFSGVNYWIKSIASILLDEYNVIIYCQSINFFKREVFNLENLTIVSIPLLSSLRFRSMTLETAWSEVLSRELDSLKKDILLIGPISGCETYNLSISKQLKCITLLVTDVRTHKYGHDPLEKVRDISLLRGRIREYVRREVETLMNSDNHFIADSRAILQHFEELFGMQIKDKTSIIPIPALEDKCAPVFKEKEILFVGRADKRKGLNYVVASWSMISNKINDWKLIIATSKGDDSDAYSSLFSLKKRTNYSLYLNINDDYKHLLLNSASIVVLPSNFESFGIVALEAMQHGCVVVSFDIGGIPEVVGSSGILVKLGDLDALNNAILLLANSESTRIELSSQSRNAVEEGFGKKVIALEFKKLIENY